MTITVKVVVEGPDFREIHEALVSDIMAHHGQTVDDWAALPEHRQISHAEDFVLYANYRRYGNRQKLRANYEVPDPAPEAETHGMQ